MQIYSALIPRLGSGYHGDLPQLKVSQLCDRGKVEFKATGTSVLVISALSSGMYSHIILELK